MLELGRAGTGDEVIPITIQGCALPAGPGRIPGFYDNPTSGAKTIPEQDLYVDGTTRGVHAVRLLVRVKKRNSLSPGVYRGAVVIDPDQHYGYPFTVPISVDVQTHAWLLVFMTAMIPTFLVGTWIVWTRARAKGADVEGYFAWLKKPAMLLAIGTAAAAAIAVWFKDYWNVPSWGGDLVGDWWKLLGVMVGAFTAALTAASVPADRASSNKGHADA
jgi:hypothetical protein